MRRKLLAIAILLSFVELASGKSKLVMSWKNPNFAPTQRYQHVLALGLSDRTQVRADFEDVLAEQLAATGLNAIPGNTILLRPESTQMDLNYLRTQIRDNKIDAVVVSRLLKVENTVTYKDGDPKVDNIGPNNNIKKGS